jgi:hypothetical protein
VGPAPAVRATRPRRTPAVETPTEDDATEPLPPPEFESGSASRQPEPESAEASEKEPGEQLTLGDAEEGTDAGEVSPPGESPGGSESESPGRSGA